MVLRRKLILVESEEVERQYSQSPAAQPARLQHSLYYTLDPLLYYNEPEQVEPVRHSRLSPSSTSTAPETTTTTTEAPDATCTANIEMQDLRERLANMFESSPDGTPANPEPDTASDSGAGAPTTPPPEVTPETAEKINGLTGALKGIVLDNAENLVKVAEAVCSNPSEAIVRQACAELLTDMKNGLENVMNASLYVIKALPEPEGHNAAVWLASHIHWLRGIFNAVPVWLTELLNQLVLRAWDGVKRLAVGLWEFLARKFTDEAICVGVTSGIQLMCRGKIQIAF